MAAELYSKANEAFVSEEHEEAVKLYTQAIELDDSREEFFSSRAHAHIKLENYKDAQADAAKAIELNASNPKAHLRKGIACFHLEEYGKAKEAFSQGQALDGNDKNFSRWIRKCEAELDLEENRTEDESPQAAVGTSSAPPQEVPPASQPPEAQPPPQPQVPMPTGPKTRYDWYQTETQVIVTVMVKNVKKEDLIVDIGEQSLSVEIQMASGSSYSLELDLLHPIMPDKSSTKIMGTKVEIKLKKEEGVRWEKLEGDPDAPKAKPIPAAAAVKSDDVHKYPTSRHVNRDWDKIVADIKQEEKDEKLEGDAALNKLFSQIYSDGSDDVRKAMNKSFVQSGGTVLSTNWSDIGKGDVDMKPPDGMEYKKWSS